MPFTRAALLALLVATSLTSHAAHAQQPLRVALFKTAADDADLADLATALDPVVLSALNELSNVSIAARPALDLPGMQLAIDCVGETRDCLGAAAKQAEADSLLAPSVQRDGAVIVVSFLLFDPNQPNAIHTVRRRYEGERPGEQALDGVRSMLEELFGAEDAPDKRAGAAPPSAEPELPVPPPEAAESEPHSGGPPIAAIILGGVGVGLIGTGIVFGVVSNASEDEAHAIHPMNEGEAHAAWKKLETAEHQATVANVAYGLGAAALVGAGVLLFWHLKDRDAPSDSEAQVALRPQLGWGAAGLTLTAAWNDNL